MSIRPAALPGAANPTAHFSRAALFPGLCVFSTLLACSLIPTRAAAQDARTILNKVTTTYSKAKTYQGRFTVHVSGKDRGGKPVTSTTTQQVKYKSPNLFAVQGTTRIVGGSAGKGRTLAQTAVSDGHTVYVYLAAPTNQYQKQNAPPQLDLLQLLKVIPSVPIPNVTLLAPANVQGHAAYVVQIQPKVPNLPPNITPQQRAQIMAQFQPARYFIDKQTYHVLKIAQSGPMQSSTVEFDSQVFNQAIADGVFHFTPPAGAKEFVPPQGMAPPGAPGR